MPSPHRRVLSPATARQATGGYRGRAAPRQSLLYLHAQDRQRKTNKANGKAAAPQQPLMRPGLPGERPFSGHLREASGGRPWQGASRRAAWGGGVRPAGVLGPPPPMQSVRGARLLPGLPIPGTAGASLAAVSRPDCRAYKPALNCLHARQMSPSCHPDGLLYLPAPSLQRSSGVCAARGTRPGAVRGES